MNLKTTSICIVSVGASRHEKKPVVELSALFERRNYDAVGLNVTSAGRLAATNRDCGRRENLRRARGDSTCRRVLHGRVHTGRFFFWAPQSRATRVSHSCPHHDSCVVCPRRLYCSALPHAARRGAAPWLVRCPPPRRPPWCSPAASSRWPSLSQRFRC